jgi:hypothetical protein
MILSENRLPLFGIMLSTKAGRKWRIGRYETNLCRGERRARSSVLPQHAGNTVTFGGQTAAFGPDPADFIET